jgi:uncharacterized protein (TIGR03067 family)
MLTGTWIPQAAEFCGQPLPLPPARMVITGDRYVIELGDARDEGTLAINVNVTPHQIDIIGTAGPNAGKTIPAIFRVRGNVLQMCYTVGEGLSPPPRPLALETGPESLQILVRYRREAP